MLRIAALALFLSSSLACIGSDLESETSSVAALEPGGAGNLSLEWAIFMGEARHDCLDAGADSVVIELSGSRGEVTQVLGCLSGLAETDEIGAGDYDVAVRLVDYEGSTLDEVALGTLTVQPDRTTPLGLVDFVVVRDPVRRDNRD